MNGRTSKSLLTIAGLTLMFSTGISAQPPQNQPPPAPPPAQQQEIELDDETLGQFVTALSAITDIRVEYSESISATQDPEEAQNLQQEAQGKMVEAVQESGLEVQTYNMIAEQMASDPALQARIEGMLEETE